MRGPVNIARAETGGADGSEERANLWMDSVGEAAMQLGVIVAAIVVVHFASSLLFGP
jgi:hypothetical protein